MQWRAFAETFITLLVIMDPAGTAPIFVGLTRRMSAGDRQRAALRAVVAAGALIIGFALVGEAVLDYLGVSVESLSIAGGLLLLLVALQMVQGNEAAPAGGGDVALVPLATPLVAGPGAIATVIVLARQHPDLSVVLGILAALLALGTSLLLADRLSRRVSPGLLQFLTSVLGLLLAALAVQLVVEGVRPLVEGG